MSKAVKNCRKKKLVKTFNNEGFFDCFLKRTKMQKMWRKQTVFGMETLPTPFPAFDISHTHTAIVTAGETCYHGRKEKRDLLRKVK